MNRTIALLALAAIAAALYFATSADAQAPTPIPSVWLQNSTPGTTQTGNVNVTGTLRAAGSGVTGVEAYGTSTGVYGKSPTASGEVYGVRGDVASPQGFGVYGLSLSATNGTGTLGRADGVGGLGVWGWSTAGTGTNYGVYGQAASVAGIGVYGLATAATGSTYGVYGRVQSVSGVGVYGLAAGTGSPIGVHGQSTSSSGYGVYGQSGSGIGVYGTSLTNVGVAGSGATYGVYSYGNLGAAGTKTFRIDHPFDPLNKYLLHYCQEGPEPKNVYDGTVITDENGAATVALPDYFEEINRDARIQLTVDDTSDDFVMVKSVGGVKNASFVIRTSKPHVKVFGK
jgi:hypothetical protein